METIRDIFLGQAYTFDATFIEDGGPYCAEQMTHFYRLSSCLFSVFLTQSIFHAFLLKFLTRPYIIAHQVEKPAQPPLFLEKILGFFQMLVLLIQIYIKAHTQRLIFILNLCHLITGFQVYLLFSTSNKSTERHFVKVICLTWAPILAVIFPTPGNAAFYGELAAYWVQHILIAFITPLTLLLCGRFSCDYLMNWKSLLYSFHYFIFYQRIVGPISMITWANISCTLCAAPSKYHLEDFIYEYIGKYYYFLAEVYFFIFCSIIMGITFFIVNMIQPKLVRKHKIV